MEGDGESLGILKGISPGSGAARSLGSPPLPGTRDPVRSTAYIFDWAW